MTRGPLIVLLILVVLAVACRPDALLDAQFWAEDGAIWHAEVNEGHEKGWCCSWGFCRNWY